MKKIIMAVPKGRILNELNPLLKKTGIIPEDDFFSKDSRKLMFETNLNFLKLIRVRSFDVATFVAMFPRLYPKQYVSKESNNSAHPNNLPSPGSI